jgi:hypothetical protein
MNEREEFEEQVFQPPRTARMIAELSRWTSRMLPEPRTLFAELSWARFYSYRFRISKPGDILGLWRTAIRDVAHQRPVGWPVWVDQPRGKWKYEKPQQLRRLNDEWEHVADREAGRKQE